MNIIGEHIDYLGGSVLPFACNLEVRITVTGPADEADFRSSYGDVEAYVRCVAEALSSHGYDVDPCRGEIESDIPVGAGLSSSAALAAAIALALTAGGPIRDPVVLQDAERCATGVVGGIMDQTAVLKARAGHAMLLDCASGVVEYVPIPASIGFVVVDTGTRRQLSDGRYAQRRAEVEAGEPRRVRHAESEQRRVYDAVDALRAGDAASLGALVSDSHASLRDDFEVSSPELDAAVDVARAHEQCCGARLVGAGFAGCVLAVVEGGAATEVAAFVQEHLPSATAFGVRAVDGAGRRA